MPFFLISYSSPDLGQCLDYQTAATHWDAICQHKKEFPHSRRPIARELSIEHKAYSLDGRDGSERGTLTDVKV